MILVIPEKEVCVVKVEAGIAVPAPDTVLPCIYPVPPASTTIEVTGAFII